MLDDIEYGIIHDGTRSLQVQKLAHKGKEYELDAHGFLAAYDEWDEDFAVAMAREAGIEGDLTEEQRARLLEIADRCPVHRTLHGEVKVRTQLA